MSRIGKMPIDIPSGVKVAVANGSVNIEGPKGKLSYTPHNDIKVVVEGSKVVCSLVRDNRQSRATWGAARSHLNNMLEGVSKGWKRALEFNGVGYGAKVQGAKLVLTVGFSHDVEFEIPKSLKCVMNKNILEIDSADKEALGTFASKVRKVQPPEPYLGKGIKYTDEVIRRKAGKTGKK